MTAPGREFWDRVAKARERLLALDYDGTLAPFRVERMEAAPLPGVTGAMERILLDRATHLAVVSGRTVAELDVLLGELAKKLYLVGSHGWERRAAGEEQITATVAEPAARRIREAHDWALPLMEQELGQGNLDRLELKPASVALHTRGVEDRVAELVKNVMEKWSSLAKDEMELLQFNGGLELRALGRDKGKAVLELASTFPDAGLVVYLGDDVTDEDAFRALSAMKAGVGIKVGPSGKTSARYVLDDCAAARDFLFDWAGAAGVAPGGRNER